MSDLPEHVGRNRGEWTSWAPEYADEAQPAWAAEEITRGVWGVEFHLGYGDWIRLLRGSGFEVVDLAELRAPESGPDHRYPGLPERWWARQWPSEQIWRPRKR